jgi:hypothetical protein
MTQQTYYYRYPRRPTMQQKHRGPASLILGALALVTSWLMIGAALGIAAVATGVSARRHAAPGVKKPTTAAVGIALGVISILIGVGVLAAFLWTLVYFNSDPCHPVKQHAGCY